jgi:hypothetical protein
MRRPSIGEPAVLVYVECACGRWGAQPEGGLFLHCSCGGRMMPGGDGSIESRRERGLAFHAILGPELQVAAEVAKHAPMFDPHEVRAGGGQVARHYPAEDVEAHMEARLRPAEPTARQLAVVERLERRGTVATHQLLHVPDGSLLAYRLARSGGAGWIEIVEPDPTGRFAVDMGVD